MQDSCIVDQNTPGATSPTKKYRYGVGIDLEGRYREVLQWREAESRTHQNSAPVVESHYIQVDRREEEVVKGLIGVTENDRWGVDAEQVDTQED